MKKATISELKYYLATNTYFQIQITDIHPTAPSELRSLLLRSENINLCVHHGKPILYPLSAINEKIWVDGKEIVSIKELKKYYGEDFELRYHVFGIKNLPLILIERLIEMHINVFNIEAMDPRELKINPYK
jgi:hypothetical protein